MMTQEVKSQFKEYYEEQFLKYNDEFLKAQKNHDIYNEQLALANMNYFLNRLDKLMK